MLVALSTCHFFFKAAGIVQEENVLGGLPNTPLQTSEAEWCQSSSSTSGLARTGMRQFFLTRNMGPSQRDGGENCLEKLVLFANLTWSQVSEKYRGLQSRAETRDRAQAFSSGEIFKARTIAAKQHSE